MGSVEQYVVNIAIEAIIILFLLLLHTSFRQTKTFMTFVPFRLLLNFMLLLLLVQIATWGLLIEEIPAKYGAMPMRIVYCLDYVFWYGASIAIYHYMEALVQEKYVYLGRSYKPSTVLRRVMLVWGVVSSLTYLVMLMIPSIYRIENGVAVFSIPAYVLLHIMSNFIFACTAIFILKHRKMLGKNDAILCIVFTLLISIFSIVDELFEFCISYVLLSLFIVILYIRIDMYKSLLLERQEKEIVQWKTQIMLSQMQPHFLYNVLTTISSLCEMQNALEARDVANRFADYMRTNLDSLGKEKTIPFEKELEHVKTYLWLEKIRFEDSLNICYEIETTDFYVPSLTVQPMVENAVKHGILPKDGVGTVIVKTYETPENFMIAVEDDGVGFDVNNWKNDTRTHVGIENVSKRLEAICGGNCEIHSEIGRGTSVLISIPKGEGL